MLTSFKKELSERENLGLQHERNQCVLALEGNQVQNLKAYSNKVLSVPFSTCDTIGDCNVRQFLFCLLFLDVTFPDDLIPLPHF